MIANLSQSFIFESAHSLKRQVPLNEYDKSIRIHGHTYTAEITFSGEIMNDGMIHIKRKGKRREPLDLFMVRKNLEEVRSKLDHRLLDDVIGLGNPTLENLCQFIGNAVAEKQLPIVRVAVSRATGDKCEIHWTI